MSPTVSSESYLRSDKILKICPAPECIVIGLGRSPTPFMIEIENRIDNSITLPLSSFRFNQFRHDLSPNEISYLHQHFDNIFGDLKKFENKTVVLIDYAQTAASLFATQQYLGDYFKKNVSNLKLSSIAITSEFHDPNFSQLDPTKQIDTYGKRIKNIYEFSDTYKIYDFKIIQIKQKSPLAELLKFSYFDEYARYKAIFKHQWTYGPERNSAYSKLKLFFKNKERKKNCIGYARNFGK